MFINNEEHHKKLKWLSDLLGVGIAIACQVLLTSFFKLPAYLVLTFISSVSTAFNKLFEFIVDLIDWVCLKFKKPE